MSSKQEASEALAALAQNLLAAGKTKVETKAAIRAEAESHGYLAADMEISTKFGVLVGVTLVNKDDTFGVMIARLTSASVAQRAAIEEEANTRLDAAGVPPMTHPRFIAARQNPADKLTARQFLVVQSVLADWSCGAWAPPAEQATGSAQVAQEAVTTGFGQD